MKNVCPDTYIIQILNKDEKIDQHSKYTWFLGNGIQLEIVCFLALFLTSIFFQSCNKDNNNEFSENPIFSLSITMGDSFESGITSNSLIEIIARDEAGNQINLAKAKIIDNNGNPVTIVLSNSDTSGMTSLSTSTYTGKGSIILSYNGDLPMPSVVTVKAEAISAAGTILSTSVSSKTPTVSKNFKWSLGTPFVVSNTTHMDQYYWKGVPDQKLSVIHKKDGTYLMAWSYEMLSSGTGPLPINQITSYKGYTGTSPWEHGCWFLNLFPLNKPFAPDETDNIVSIYHAESDYTGYYDKITAITYSHNGGKTWEAGKPVVTPTGWPDVPQAGHSGDCAAMFDPVNKQWVLFYSGESITMAISKDPAAASGTWKKFYNGGFTEPGLGGRETPNSAFTSRYFSSPSVCWNSYLGVWVMTMDGHPGIWISASEDLYTWTNPVKLCDGSDLPGNPDINYSTIMGPNDEKVAGKEATLFYGKFPTDKSNRSLIQRTITFERND